MSDEARGAQSKRAKKATGGPGPGRNIKLTAEAQATIVEAIQRGAFDHIAAEAAGVTGRTFRNWMERGAEEARGLYADFYAAVIQARAKARINAEARVYETEPYKWLRFGPGRDRPGSPGWTDSDGSGPMTEITQGDMVIRTFWGRASETPPPRVAEIEEAAPREASEADDESSTDEPPLAG